MAPYSEFALTEGEKADGLILACRAVPWSACEVAWLDVEDMVVHPRRRLLCRVASLDRATHDIRIVRLEVLSGGPFSYSAGQYAGLTFGDLPPRDYSMASRPEEPVLEFHIRRMAGGGASTYALERLAEGEEVRLEGPFGAAHLRENYRGPMLAIAGGSGLAPIKSIVESALAAGMAQPIHLYFGVRGERDLYLTDHFGALARRHRNFAFHPVLSEPEGPSSHRTGLVHAAIAADFADLDGFKAYLAGPPVMVEAATGMLFERGMRREDIHADAFYSEAEKARLEAKA